MIFCFLKGPCALSTYVSADWKTSARSMCKVKGSFLLSTKVLMADEFLRLMAGTVEKIRSQRAHSIQMPDQYLFCHTAILECAAAAGLLQPGEVASLDEDDSSGTD